MSTTNPSNQADRFHPGELWLDSDGVHINAHGGGVLLHGGVYYWFGEHKTAGQAGNLANVGVRVYSSTDLLHWTNRGIALPVSDNPDSPIIRGCVLERPKVLFNPRSEKFVMWFHLEPPGVGYAGALSGVAVSDSVVGPYQFVKAFRPNAKAWPANVSPEGRVPLTPTQTNFIASLKLVGGPVSGYPKDLIYRRDFTGGQMARDMTLFVDDDGSAYHLYASEDNGTLHISRLSEDYLDSTGDYVRIFSGRFHEAPAIFKHGYRYYLFSSDCTGWSPNAARLSVAESIRGPWTELGNPCRGTADQQASTFEAQSTFVLPVAGKPGSLIFMADRWRPENAIDGRYVWLPVRFDPQGVPFIQWLDSWSLSDLE